MNILEDFLTSEDIFPFWQYNYKQVGFAEFAWWAGGGCQCKVDLYLG